MIVCGGDDYFARDNCIEMDDDGEWNVLGFTQEHRDDHACWSVDGGVFLMGGDYDEQSTEMFSTELGSSETRFRLEYPSRGACVIDDDMTGTVIVTAREQVARYDGDGWLEDLPRMQQLRNWHACTSFTADNGNNTLYRQSNKS